MRKDEEKWALFWCRLLHPVIFGEIKGAEINRYLRELCQGEVLFPNGEKRKPSLSTLRRKLRTYQRDGFTALKRKGRSDRGKPRTVSESVIRKAVEIKKDQPCRSDVTINQLLKSLTGESIHRSTLYRHLKQHNATRAKLGVLRKKVRKRWTTENTHDIWVGDFMHGVYVHTDTDAVPTQLCLWIDAYSRYIIEGRYYYRQSLDILIDSLLRAWSQHGKSSAIYIDNAKVYHSDPLEAACYALQIEIIHSRARDPASRGLVERVFRTIQGQFEAEVRSGLIRTLADLNEAFAAWLKVGYHEQIHSETGQTPRERYHQGVSAIRHVDMAEAVQYFMRSENRTVNRTYADISLYGRFYRVDPRYRGDRVEVRFDPYSDMHTILIYNRNGAYLGEGVLYYREVGADTQPAASPSRLKYDYLALLKAQHEEILKKQTRGIDYRKITRSRTWSFHAFVRKLAKLMGRKGGVSGFQTDEMESLRQLYERMPQLKETMLMKAWKSAKEKTVPYIVLELKHIAEREI
jgi:transposase InsO family protein